MDKQEKSLNKGIKLQIKKGDKQGVDLRPFVAEGYDGEQLREIRVAHKNGIDLSSYVKEGFCGAQLRQIRKGIGSFVDVKQYADIRYNWLQMKEIRLGLENRIDVSKYTNSLYSYSQMKEIRLGLEEGIDVSSYADLMYSRSDMEQKRHLLTAQLYESGKNRKDSEIVDEGTGIVIKLTDNRMKAYITFPREQEKVHLTVDYVEQILKRNGIITGIKRSNIEEALKQEIFEKDILVAKGDAPQIGENGRYEFLFDIEPSRKPVELEDGKVDYQNVDIFEEVMEDQPIARYIGPQKGNSGTTVGGMEIPGIMGKELPMLKGKGFKLKEDGVTYVAAVPGIIEYKDEEINIYETLMIREDVNAAYGNVSFHGCVHIFGNVGPNVEVVAVGSITVEGTVESSKIFSNGDVLLKKGMVGAGKGIIRATGTIAGNFFEAADLQAGKNIEAGYLMNSKSYAGNRVITQGKRGAIIGGTTTGVYGIEANHIGNRSQLLTEIETGGSQKMLAEVQQYQDEYESIQKQIIEIVNIMGRYKGAERQSMAFKKLQAQQAQLREQAEALRKERYKLQKLLSKDNVIRVLSKAYAGTKITINQVTRRLDEDVSCVKFCLEEQQIVEK